MKLFVQRVGFQVLAAIVGMAISVLTARWLGPAGKGELSLVLLVAHVGASLGALGLNEATPFLCHRQGIPLGRFVAATPLHVVLIGVPLALACGLFLHLGGGGLGRGVVGGPVVLLAMLLLWTRLLVMLLRGVIRADERFDTVLLVDALEIATPLAVFAAICLVAPASVGVATLAFAAGTALAAVACLAASRRYGAGPLALGPWREHVRSIWSYGATTQLRYTGVLVVQRANFFVVGAILGMAELGLYAVATAVAEVLVKIPDAASWIVTPRSARATTDAAHRLTLSYARWVLAMSAAGALVIGLVAEPAMVFLFDREFAGATPALVAMLVGVVALSYARVLEASLIGRGGAKPVALATWLSGVVLLIMDLLLIPSRGLVGAAAAASCGYVANAALITLAYIRDRRSSDA